MPLSHGTLREMLLKMGDQSSNIFQHFGQHFQYVTYAQGSDLSRTYGHMTYHYCCFMIGHSLERMGIGREDHACEPRLPHINRNVARK